MQIPTFDELLAALSSPIVTPEFSGNTQAAEELVTDTSQMIREMYIAMKKQEKVTAASGGGGLGAIGNPAITAIIQE